MTVMTVTEDAARPSEFASFYRNEFRAVVGLAYVMSGSSIAAEDLAQEAFAAAFRNWERIRTYDQPAAWVRHVVANRARSRYRRLGAERRAVRRLAGREPRIHELPEQSGEVWAAVRRLPRQQAVAIALTYYADLSIEQIAAAMGCRQGTVKTHLKRGRAALRATLGLQDEEPA